MRLILNGQERDFPTLPSGANLAALVATLALKSDRVAIEHNGTIVARTGWTEALLSDGDTLELVHFVGGGQAGLLA